MCKDLRFTEGPEDGQIPDELLIKISPNMKGKTIIISHLINEG